MRLNRRHLTVLTLLAVAVIAAGPALAKSSLGIGTAEAGGMPTGPFAGLFLAINAWQREFLMALNRALVTVKNGGSGGAILVGLSFAYGVFHAAGPGHGKAVISSYVLADRVQLRRGILLSFASSALQAVVAILVALAGWFFLRGTGITMTDAAQWLEIGSFALVTAFGAWLVLRTLARIARRSRFRPSFARPAPATMRLADGGMLAFAAPARTAPVPIMPPASVGLAPGVCTDDEADCDCGRPHMVDPSRLGEKQLSVAAALSTVVAVGIRPCWGAVSVMAFALVNGLVAAGVVSVFAVALGTAITVSAIAAVAVFAKGAALRLASGGRRYRLVMDAVELAGASLVFALGALLLGGALV